MRRTSLLVLYAVINSAWGQYKTTEPEFWNVKGRARIEKRIATPKRDIPPKNVIFFLGDGMGISTVTAGRVWAGQRDKREDINRNHFFEDLEHVGLVKTSSQNFHTTDSAAGAVALFSGRKVDQTFLLTKPGSGFQCSEREQSHINDGIAEMALKAGMKVGVVTTTRITHATPAATYAKGVNRSMEHDESTVGTECTDIAKQILQYPANQFTVLMGGGRDWLIPKTESGKRLDRLNIQHEWNKLDGRRKVLNSIEDLEKLSPDEADHVLATFSKDSLPFWADQKANNNKTTPRLLEMTKKAIEILSRGDSGYFLMVEGGLIDWAEHRNEMHVAFEELVEFDETIRMTRGMTKSDETLIIVTADHAHALTLPGYVPKKQSIFSHAAPKTADATNYTVGNMSAMFFATGPGYKTPKNYTKDMMNSLHFVTPAHYHLKAGAHGGEDVGIWTDGPFSWLFSGTIENTQVAYTIKYLLCLDKNEPNICKLRKLTDFEEKPFITKSEKVLQDLNSPTVLMSMVVLFSFLSFVFLALLLALRVKTFYAVNDKTKDVERM